MSETRECPYEDCDWSMTGDDTRTAVAVMSHVSAVHITDEVRAAMRAHVDRGAGDIDG